MKKEELMYGNKLLFLNEVVTFSNISQIREDGIFWIKTIESKIDSKSFHFKPIPITEEWLLKFGFFKHNNAYVLEKPNENIMNFKFSIWSDFTYNSSEFPVELKYVHQLQNLYFALTGTHLKLK
mgnify:FL=1